MSLLDDLLTQFTADTVAEYTAGGLEPDGVALAFGTRTADDVDSLGWGTDLRCDSDITANADEVDSNSTESVVQDLWHRLTTPHGQILNDPELLVAVGEDPDYGYGLDLALSVGVTPLELQVHQDLGAAECRKDDRVRTCDLTIESTGAINEFFVTLSGELKTGEVYKLVKTLRNGQEQIEAESK
jgi:hypothetical protein